MSWIWGSDVTAEQANMVVMSLQGELDERQATIETLLKALQKEKQDYKQALIEEVDDLRERKEALQRELAQIDALIDTKTQQIKSGDKPKAKKKGAAPKSAPSAVTASAAPPKAAPKPAPSSQPAACEPESEASTAATSLTSIPCNPELEKVRGVDADTAFIIQRSNNANTVVYKGNLSSDALDAKSPLHVYWIMYALPGPPFPTEELNVIERNTAYGATTSPSTSTPGEYDLALASLKDRRITLVVDSTRRVRARTTIDGRANVYLERVFVQSTTSWGLPKVEYVEIFGVDPASGDSVYEKKLP
ncbi:Aste57867_12952 [Aphanomyces stellatus]|uniref:Aste57867_12952 protein n=1 Tax=Aphanomyces stellatus TaxID=120398 RepID=A0A485KX96_9STRA|nr:hypothetical protein As57867_012904 [Aphanomyces stellatus]VFT89798.1 Aste57867_12952 [Aphanomyces stellatus]